jgi:phosphate butyryltransferase
MVLKNFNQLVNLVKGKRKRVLVLAVAQDEHAIGAVYRAEQDGIISSILVGDEKLIRQVIDIEGIKNWSPHIIHEENLDKSAETAVELVKQGKADFLMKGKIETERLLKAVVNKEFGLSKGRLMSHFVIQEIPTYHKLLVTTDGGMILYPNLEDKKAIIENAVEILNKLGYEEPKVAVLSAVEKLNIKMPETIDAAKLKELNKNGEIKNCYVEGPISFDLAFSSDVAKIKGYISPVCGDADIMIVPNIAAGNILGKSLVCAAKAKMAGIIVGAEVPIVLTSRSSSFEEKYMSIVLAAAI